MKGLCLTGSQISLKVQVFPSTSDSPIQPWSTSHVSVTLSFKINQNIRILEQWIMYSMLSGRGLKLVVYDKFK